MKLSFSTLGCPGWTVEQAFAAAKEYGFEGIELRLLDGEVIEPATLRSNLDRITKASRDSGIELVALGTSCRFSSPDPMERQRNEELAIEFVLLAKELQASVVRVFGGQRAAGQTMAESIGFVADGLNRVAPSAESAGVAVVLETHDDFSRATDVAAVLSRVGSRSVGALWDIQPTFEMGESAARVLELLGDRVLHTHVKDARPGSGKDWDLVLLGEGVVPTGESLRSLAAHGYAGYASVEWEKKWHPELAEPEVALPHHLRMLRQYLKRPSGVN
jgi:sugar phosphate isomerase/epimerase